MESYVVLLHIYLGLVFRFCQCRVYFALPCSYEHSCFRLASTDFPCDNCCHPFIRVFYLWPQHASGMHTWSHVCNITLTYLPCLPITDSIQVFSFSHANYPLLRIGFGYCPHICYCLFWTSHMLGFFCTSALGSFGFYWCLWECGAFPVRGFHLTSSYKL